MQIESTAFEDHQFIPAKYTCDGEDVSPPLKFLHLPQGVKSLVLIVDDPDAPQGTFDHWIVWNIAPQLIELTDGAPEFTRASPPPKQGVNHFQKSYYKGPCPPPGKPHHYHFKLYALDAILSLPEGSAKHDVEAAMKKHKILDQAELVGLYQH